MKIKPFILVLIGTVFSIGDAFSQNREIDSLRVALAYSKKEDTGKVNTLNALARALRNNDADTAMYFSGRALTLATKLNYEPGIADAKSGMGLIMSNLGKWDEGLKNCIDAIKLYDQLLRSENTADKSKILQQQAYAYNSAGIIYLQQGNYPESLKNLFAALKIREETGDKKGVSYTQNNLGIIYFTQHNYAEALKHYSASLKIREELGDKRGASDSYNNIGIIYENQHNHPEALKNYFTSLKLAKEINYQEGLASAYLNIGIIQTEQGNYAEALKNLFASLKIYEGTGNKEAIATCYGNIGNYYTKRRQFGEAAHYLNKHLALSLEIGSLDNIKEGYKDLAKMDSAEGNYQQALQHYKSYIIYRDSLFNEENTRKLVQSQMQYDFDKKEDSLKQQHFITETKLQAQHKQRYFYWGGLAMLAALAFFVFLNFRNQKKINRLAGDAHAKEKAELELQSLRAQLNPHFMFNSLNAIQELILLEENEKSQSYLARFAKLLRMLLENAERPFIPLQREIDFLHLYLSLENLRIPDLQHSLTVDPAIDTEQTMIPNMILQPFIENAIWHGLSHKQGDRRLQMRINRTNGFIKYEIEDNGVGRKKSAELKSLYRKEHKSKGMELLSKRFKLLAKEFGSDIETRIEDVISGNEIAGTIVTIKVPSKFSETSKNLIS